jgi:alpha-L-rhamnosidase
VPDYRLSSAAARHVTPYGEAAVAWERTSGRLTLRVTVPVGATATVHVPGEAAPVEVRHGQHEWTVTDPFGPEPELSPDPTVRQVLDHERTWQALVAAAVATGVAADEAELADRLARYLDFPVTGLVDAATASGFMRGADVDAFRARLDSLFNQH